MAKGEFIHEGRTFTFKQTLKPVKVEYVKYHHHLVIEGKDKAYIKKNYKKLKEIIDLYYLHEIP